MGVKCDFSGWATRNNLKCSDGRIICPNAFQVNDGQTVPLVWNHQHNETNNILGHALLENRADGVYAYCSFNDTESAHDAKEMVRHGDIRALSIYANNLKQRGSEVLHGAIREVSLVLAGANPGAMIESVYLAHSDEPLEDEFVLYTGEPIDNTTLSHAFGTQKPDEEPSSNEGDPSKVEELKPAAKQPLNEGKEKKSMGNEEMTVQDVIDTMDEDQKKVLYALVGMAAQGDLEDGGNEDMKHNAFDDGWYDEDTLVHDGLNTILADGKRCGTLKESYLQHADEYGIDNIDWLFPDAQAVNGGAPEFITRKPDDWVKVVMNGVHHTPFARIKMMFADLRDDDARAKGYATKGKLKKEQVFGLLKRKVDPTTIYKKQKLDRDDVIDITDFDVVSWIKGEMRSQLDEEIARAILFGDLRPSSSEDKIPEANIIPIFSDASLYTIEQNPTGTGTSGAVTPEDIIDACVKGQVNYEGSGALTAFVKNSDVTDMLLIKDKDGHRMYKNVEEIALAMNVSKVCKVPDTIVPSGVYALLVDLKDYNVGADKGGAVNMFDDFDIDYNQQKYLIETRCSGALTKPFSAICIKAEN